MTLNSTLSHRDQEPENSVLYLVGTPIGNLNDISLRALDILKNVSFIACEDTRQTKKIMNRFKFHNILLSFNKDNSLKRIPKIISQLKSGKSVALVSDAGLPGISDPGEDLVKNVRLNKLEVICIPGPCAALTALVSSGLPSSRFIFEGFLPRKKIEREKIIFEISKNEKTTILYESPHRLKKLLNELKEICGGTRQIIVSRELTKKFEEHIGNTIDMVIDFYQNREVFGEITLLVGGLEKSKNLEFDKLQLKNDLNELIEAGLSLSAASKYLAKKKSLTKNLIYNLHR